MTTVAVLGLGAMGSRMAARYLAAGHPVRVWNRSAGAAEGLAGATVAATPAEAAAGADVVIAMVRDDEASARVWLEADGALSAMDGAGLALEMSTVSPAHARRLGEAAAARSVPFAEAPVAGSRPQAEAGALLVMVGGEAGVAARAEAVLGPVAAAVHPTGPVGTAALTKLAVNGMLAGQVALLSELYATLRRGGMDGERAVAVLSAMPVLSPAAAGALKGIAAEAFAPMFPVALVVKDLAYALGAADEAGVDAGVLRGVLGAYEAADAAGFGAQNITAVARLNAPR